ncbi:Zinc finger CCHC domain-containing protein 7 [Echinococcus granulosus]|uniref:Zinc finger CCHC domain-containing protein 7 n=1 Tax=Echinococcus granulosus TaxID=6210 RepID=W6U5H3_ECHGR|nr:Zinc finger CCHC domain-containing protein 7 [Echinococcus granulosus]EUB56428.1 Zinc finger CCHC domain-containing protein 7 [Echinococcus granulosus]
MYSDELKYSSEGGSDSQSCLMDALYLTFSGIAPKHVLKQAEERVNGVVNESNKCNVSESRWEADDENAFIKVEGLDVIIGCRNPSSMVDLDDTKKFFEERCKDMPSDPKQWRLDPCDMDPSLKRHDREFHRGPCYSCFRDGHIARFCTKGPQPCHFCAWTTHSSYCCTYLLCDICHSPGHEYYCCPNRKLLRKINCRRCKRRGHTGSACPDIWRQYRHTTKPGKPVVVDSPRKPVATTCCNCGSSSHTGDSCEKSCVTRCPVPLSSICQFDDHDVYSRDGLYRPKKIGPYTYAEAARAGLSKSSHGDITKRSCQPEDGEWMDAEWMTYGTFGARAYGLLTDQSDLRTCHFYL